MTKKSRRVRFVRPVKAGNQLVIEPTTTQPSAARGNHVPHPPVSGVVPLDIGKPPGNNPPIRFMLSSLTNKELVKVFGFVDIPANTFVLGPVDDATANVAKQAIFDLVVSKMGELFDVDAEVKLSLEECITEYFHPTTTGRDLFCFTAVVGDTTSPRSSFMGAIQHSIKTTTHNAVLLCHLPKDFIDTICGLVMSLLEDENLDDTILRGMAPFFPSDLKEAWKFHQAFVHKDPNVPKTFAETLHHVPGIGWNSNIAVHMVRFSPAMSGYSQLPPAPPSPSDPDGAPRAQLVPTVELQAGSSTDPPAANVTASNVTSMTSSTATISTTGTTAPSPSETPASSPSSSQKQGSPPGQPPPRSPIAPSGATPPRGPTPPAGTSLLRHRATPEHERKPPPTASQPEPQDAHASTAAPAPSATPPPVAPPASIDAHAREMSSFHAFEAHASAP